MAAVTTALTLAGSQYGAICSVLWRRLPVTALSLAPSFGPSVQKSVVDRLLAVEVDVAFIPVDDEDQLPFGGAGDGISVGGGVDVSVSFGDRELSVIGSRGGRGGRGRNGFLPLGGEGSCGGGSVLVVGGGSVAVGGLSLPQGSRRGGGRDSVLLGGGRAGGSVLVLVAVVSGR